MKDIQHVMSVEVEVCTQSAMPAALKTLSPIDGNDLFSMRNGDKDLAAENDFVLREEDEEEEEKTDETNETSEVANGKEMPPETEDEILNKFDTNDTFEGDLLNEDKLLEDSEDIEIDTIKLNGTHVFDTVEDCAIPNGSGVPPDSVQDIADNEPVLQNGHVSDNEEQNIVNHEENMEIDDKTKAEQDAELLKNQIMDTEDLLQIIEDNKDTPTEAEIVEHEQDEDIADTEIDEEFDSEQITTDDDQLVKDDLESKDLDDIEVENEEAYIISNENSSCADKDDVIVIDEKMVVVETDDKDLEIVVENDATLILPPSLEKDCELVDAIDCGAAKLTPDIEEKTPKRSLTDAYSESESKKLKLEENDKFMNDKKVKEDCDQARIEKICSKRTFSDFMRNKGIEKLTRADLEEFCLQKMCEAIFHRSELGELRHKLGVQEQMIEMWRKEVVQLTKQARDLEIVNKRLLHEVRQKYDREKPLIPVKITRSVGLQVRCDSMINVITPKRRTPRPQPNSIIQAIAPKPIIQPSTPPIPTINKSPITGTTVSNATKPPTKIITTKANSLLTQALANASVASSSPTIKSPIKSIATNTPVRVIPVKQPVVKTVLPKVAAVLTPTNSTKPIDKTFIDLTDEEEKKPQSVPVPNVIPVTTANVRIVKTTTVVSPSSVATPNRIVYVYNNQLHQGLIAGDANKSGGKFMFKLNNMVGQTNGVLTTVSSGSLAMGSTPLRPVQPVRFAAPAPPVRNTLTTAKTVLKHPAPLPPPPLSQLNIAARKPIPPKPHLTIRRSSGGIVLSWKMPYNLDNYESIASYQLYAYQETTALPNSDMWRKVGDVKALALPMACTLTQFADGNKYHFAVRAVDVHKRMGQFSDPEQILL